MISRRSIQVAISLVFALTAGCGVDLRDPNGFRFLAPLTIEKVEVASAIIDTGGGYEILLRSTYDLPIVDEVDVVTFRGIERVAVTGPFNYTTGSISAVSEGAIVGISTCDCNGLGFEFFRKTGLVLALDFDFRQAAFLATAPLGGIRIPFGNHLETFQEFDAAFLRIMVDIDGLQIPVSALVDTGTTKTIIQREFTEDFVIQQADTIELTLTQSQLGGVKLVAGLFDNKALPDIIIGLDVMKVWGSQWFFDFTHERSSFTVFPNPANITPAARVIP